MLFKLHNGGECLVLKEKGKKMHVVLGYLTLTASTYFTQNVFMWEYSKYWNSM